MITPYDTPAPPATAGEILTVVTRHEDSGSVWVQAADGRERWVPDNTAEALRCGVVFAPGLVVLAAPDGAVGQVAGDVAFPNGMAITPDGGTLIVAESYASRLTAYDIGPDGGLGRRRVWAETPGDHPDGICIDAECAVWYADVGSQHCVRVREGGAVLATVSLDRGAFACALSRGHDPRLFVVGQNFGGPEPAQPSGRVVAFPAPVPGAGKP